MLMAGIMTWNEHANKQENSNQEHYETVVIEEAITKIGHLLALGFGEAGSAIISKNITGEGELNPMVEGQRTYAVFGFCDIRHFSTVTEGLQTRIMTFVNQIAEIAHSQVDKYGGAVNKNLGEAFLMMWKFHDPEEFKSRESI
jgi:class 3 adenylate cyclase